MKEILRLTLSIGLVCLVGGAALAYVNAKTEAPRQAAADRTNRISGTFLLHSGMALANAAICDLDRSIFTYMDIAAANRAIERVLAIGSTSGADMLTGIVLGLRQHIGGNET